MPNHFFFSVTHFLWVACVQRVSLLCVSIGQVVGLSHNQNATSQQLRINQRFLHGLYYFCTQYLPTACYTLTPLFIYPFSTLSTRLTKTTTLINK